MSAQVKWREDRGGWYLIVYDSGSRRVKRLGATLADKRRGERRAKEWNEKRLRGAIGLEKPKPKAIPFEDFAKRWLRAKVQLPIERGLKGAVAPKTARQREQMLRLHLLPHLGTEDIRSIDVAAVDRLWERYLELGRPRSQRSIEIALGVLRLVLADAVGKGFLPANPVVQWKAVQPRGRSTSGARPLEDGRALESEEREHLLSVAAAEAPAYFPFILFLAETGCRIGEAINLRWADVDCEAASAQLYRSKTGGWDEVELSSRLLAEVATLKPDIHPKEALAFTTPAGHPIRYENFRRRIWNPISCQAFDGDRRVTPHSLRHTWASLHMARGTPIEWVRTMGGWASAKMVLDVYGHFLPREMRGYSDALAPGDRTGPHQTVSEA
jgi:integrase